MVFITSPPIRAGVGVQVDRDPVTSRAQSYPASRGGDTAEVRAASCNPPRGQLWRFGVGRSLVVPLRGRGLWTCSSVRAPLRPPRAAFRIVVRVTDRVRERGNC